MELMKYLLTLAFFLMSLSAYATEEGKNRYKINAEAVTYSGVEDQKFKVRPANVYYEFNALGIDFELKDFSDDYSKPFYSDELEKNYPDDIQF